MFKSHEEMVFTSKFSPILYLVTISIVNVVFLFWVYRRQTRNRRYHPAARISLLLSIACAQIFVSLWLYAFIVGCREGNGDGVDENGNFRGDHGTNNDFLCSAAYVMILFLLLGLVFLCTFCQMRHRPYRTVATSVATGGSIPVSIGEELSSGPALLPAPPEPDGGVLAAGREGAEGS